MLLLISAVFALLAAAPSAPVYAPAHTHVVRNCAPDPQITSCAPAQAEAGCTTRLNRAARPTCFEADTQRAVDLNGAPPLPTSDFDPARNLQPSWGTGATPVTAG